MTKTKQAWVLTSHPSGIPSEDNWRLEEQPLPELADGEVLARAVYLSVDPYMRGRISAKANYAAGVGIADVMHGGGVGEMLESLHPDWAAAPRQVFEIETAQSPAYGGVGGEQFIREFVHAAQGRGSPPTTGQDALPVARVTDAAYVSSETGKRLNIELPTP